MQINRVQQINFSTNVAMDRLEEMDWLIDSSVDNQHELTLFHTYDEEAEDNLVAAMRVKPYGKEPQLVVPEEPMDFYEFADEYVFDKLHTNYGVTPKQFEYVYWTGPFETEGEIEDALEKGYKNIGSYGEESGLELDASKIKKSLLANPNDCLVVMRCVYNGEVELAEGELANFDPFDHEDDIQLDDEMQAIVCIYKK
jgi:hypothetical protein